MGLIATASNMPPSRFLIREDMRGLEVIADITTSHEIALKAVTTVGPRDDVIAFWFLDALSSSVGDNRPEGKRTVSTVVFLLGYCAVKLALREESRHDGDSTRIRFSRPESI